MFPRRCPPSWLGWQLHVNGGGILVGLVLAGALPGGQARVLLCGPARVLPWRAVVPGKDLAEGLMDFHGKDLTEDRRLLVLI